MTRANYNLNRFIRNAIYRMKHDYGGEITLYQLTSATTDRATGVKSEAHTSILIPRAVVLPVNVRREVIQSISAISANKKLVMGGSFDSGLRVFIIDRRDAPGYEITNDDWIVYEHKRYDLKSVEEFEQSTAWLITGKCVEGAPPEEDIRVNGENTVFNLSQAVTGVTAQHEPRAYGTQALALTQSATGTI